MRRVALLSALFVCHCATVPAGHRGVVTSPFSGVQPDVLGEGVRWAGLGSRVDLFDLRQHEVNEDLEGISADGAPVRANSSVVTYRIVPDELVQLEKQVGSDPYESFVRPVIRSGVRRVLSRYTARQLLDSRNIPDIQNEIKTTVEPRARAMHIVLDAVYVRSLVIPLKGLQEEILDTSVSEQKLLTMPHELALARAHALALREKAHAIKQAHQIIEPTLNPQTLNDARTRAEISLLKRADLIILPKESKTLVEVPP